MLKIRHIAKRILGPLLFVGILLFSMSQSVFALQAEQRRFIASKGGRYFDVNVGCASDEANGKIYFLGDSLTVGMRDQGGLSSKFEANGWSTVTIQATNGDGISNVLPKVDADQAVISQASTVVIGLGTNREPDFDAQVTALVNKIRGFSDQIRIYWVNVYTAPGAYIDGGDAENQRVNRIINDKATELGFTVINWRSEATTNPDTYPFTAEGVHHTPAGYDARSAFLAAQVGTPPAALGGASSTAGGATGLVGDTPEEQIFNYLLGKEVHGQALKDFQVAGILGNVWAESAFRFQRLQGTGVDEITTAEQARGSGSGWGFVQWTPAGKMINPTMDAGKDANDGIVQMDFLLEQLNGGTTSPEGPAGDALIAAGDVGAATLAFETQYERHAGGPQPERIVEAQRILDEGFAGGGGGGCGGGGDSNFSAKVLGYAWETYHRAPYLETKPEYATAITSAQSSGQYVGGNSHPGIDCGGFITRLMIDSAFEPEFNYSGVIADGANNIPLGFTPWLEANWDKVTISGTEDLKPGDVAVNTGRSHAFVFVGDVDGFDSQVASASLGSGPDGSWRSPMAGTEDPLSSNVEWYRQR